MEGVLVIAGQGGGLWGHDLMSMTIGVEVDLHMRLQECIPPKRHPLHHTADHVVTVFTEQLLERDLEVEVKQEVIPLDLEVGITRPRKEVTVLTA